MVLFVRATREKSAVLKGFRRISTDRARRKKRGPLVKAAKQLIPGGYRLAVPNPTGMPSQTSSTALSQRSLFQRRGWTSSEIFRLVELLDSITSRMQPRRSMSYPRDQPYGRRRWPSWHRRCLTRRQTSIRTDSRLPTSRRSTRSASPSGRPPLKWSEWSKGLQGLRASQPIFPVRINAHVSRATPLLPLSWS